MTLATVVQFVIYAHAALGGIAFIAGALAVLTKKGSPLHKRTGKLFYYTMLISVLISLVIAVMPNHISPFLFSIGVLSIYLLVSGRRSLYIHQPTTDLRIDKIIAGIIILTGMTMIGSALMLYEHTHMVLLMFGIGSLLLGIQDLYIYSDPQRVLDNWLAAHLGKMMGGYIAAITALFVVNNVLPGTWNWYGPSIVGGLIIVYWKRQIKTRNNAQ